MSFGFGIGDCLDLIDRGITIYQKIKDAPNQIKEIGWRMDRLKFWLQSLRDRLDEQRALNNNLKPAQSREIKTITKEIRSIAEKILVILKQWEDNIGPLGLELRFEAVARALFALGSSPKRLQDLADDLDRRKREVMDQVNLLPSVALRPGQTPAREPSPAPVPKNKTNLNVIFLDSYNEARSVVTMAYAQLVREWTVGANHAWPLQSIHSAGFKVESESGMVEYAKACRFDRLKFGAVTPKQVAVDALFQNDRFDYPYKQQLLQKILERKSRGPASTLFTFYDYIFVFTRDDFIKVERLKEAQLGKGAPGAKAQLVLLGEFGHWNISEIKDPQPDTRANWNNTMGNIKFSFKQFLKKELDYRQPPWGPPQKG